MKLSHILRPAQETSHHSLLVLSVVVSALLGILYLDPSSSDLRRNQPAARISVREQLMAGSKPELND